MSVETDEITLEQAQAVIEADKARTPAAALERVRVKLNMPTLRRIVKHGRDGSLYVLELDGEEVELGNAKALFKKVDFDAAIMAQTRHLPPDRKPADHRELVGLIERAAVQLDNVASTNDETAGWIAAYARASRVLEGVDRDDRAQMWDIVNAADPPSFWDRAGRLHLRLLDFSKYINRQMGIHVKHKDLSVRLSQLGFDKPDDGGMVTVRPTSGGDPTSARYWVSQPAFEVER